MAVSTGYPSTPGTPEEEEEFLLYASEVDTEEAPGGDPGTLQPEVTSVTMATPIGNGASCWGRMRNFVACVAVFNVMYTTLEMYVVAILSTLERRYGFSSAQTGALISVKETANVALCACVTHCARNTHRPRFLAVSGILGTSEICSGSTVLCVAWRFD